MPAPFSLGSVLDFVKLGVQSNWWGLACPAHCGPPSLTSLVLAFASGLGFGLFLGIGLVLLVAFRFGLLHLLLSSGTSSPPARPAPGTPSGSDRIRAYLYER